jgi:hypothetical protein
MSTISGNYLIAKDAAAANAISARRLRQLIQDGQVPGAVQAGARVWLVPADWRYSKPKMGPKGGGVR